MDLGKVCELRLHSPDCLRADINATLCQLRVYLRTQFLKVITRYVEKKDTFLHSVFKCTLPPDPRRKSP